MQLALGFLATLAVAGIAVVAQKDEADSAATEKESDYAETKSKMSHVQGKAFDRIAVIWLENTDDREALSDPNLQYLASKGVLLSNYYGVTHPSEPNYIAAIGGDYFGMNNDKVNAVPANVSTLIDLLEDKGISWAEYQEDMPYSGFQGGSYSKTSASDYVRKHNPAIIYDSVATNSERSANIKNFTLFESDLKANTLPQWMFITPNMRNDGHDTSVTFAGSWVRNFMEPLLTNKNFMDNTLVLITFDEDETYPQQNHVMAILLGDAVPNHLVGTTDSNYYNHYSEIATVEANWGLHTLGRWDVGANVFSLVAAKTGDKLRQWVKPAFDTMFFNSSYPGLFNSQKPAPLAVPNTAATYSGRTVLPKIVKTWEKFQKQTYYTTAVEIPDGLHPPA